MISRHSRSGADAVHFAGGGDHAGRAGVAAIGARPVRPRSCRRSPGLSHSALGRRARREARSVEFRLRRDAPRGARGQNGQADFIWIEMRCRPLEAAPDAVPASEAEVVAVMRDVTDRKIRSRRLISRTAAEQADASKTRFLATMSHELRTPLNAIIGFSEMIVQEDVLMIDAARRKEYAQLINDSGQHLLGVVNGILDMSKMEIRQFRDFAGAVRAARRDAQLLQPAGP